MTVKEVRAVLFISDRIEEKDLCEKLCENLNITKRTAYKYIRVVKIAKGIKVIKEATASEISNLKDYISNHFSDDDIELTASIKFDVCRRTVRKYIKEQTKINEEFEKL